MGLFGGESKASTTSTQTTQGANGLNDASGARGPSFVFSNLTRSSPKIEINGLMGEDITNIFSQFSAQSAPIAAIAQTLSGAQSGFERIARQYGPWLLLIIAGLFAYSSFSKDRK